MSGDLSKKTEWEIFFLINKNHYLCKTNLVHCGAKVPAVAPRCH